MQPMTDRLVQAQAHAEANPLPTSLKLWRDGVAVEMWKDGQRIERRARWRQIETAITNPLLLIIDQCADELMNR